jgi:hypothetical protein
MSEERNALSEDYLYQVPSLQEQYNRDQTDEEMASEQFIQPVFAGHNENLANVLDETVLTKISANLIDDIENDLSSRKDWENGLSEILKQLGIKIDKRTFPFDGASGIYSPVVMRTVVEFFVNAVPELLPLEGPVKQRIVGQVSDELQDIANRVELWTNLFFTKEAPEYYSDLKKMLIWLVIVGNMVRKTYFDPILKRPTSKFLMPQNFIVKYGTTDLETCTRMTEVKDDMSKFDIAKYQQMGIYRDIHLSDNEEGIESNLKKTLNYVEGVSIPNYENNDIYPLYECHVNLDIQELADNEGTENDAEENLKDSNYRPYIVTIDQKSKKVLALYRNWQEGDENYERIDFFTNYVFMEGLGFYGMGAAHLICGLAEGSTQLLRQTLDGQTLSNFPGGLRAKGMRDTDNNIKVGPTEFIEIDTGGQRIQDVIMHMPYKEPSPYINELRKELEASAAGIMGAANSQIADFNPNVPVGTTYALLGLLYKVQSTVIRGIRDSMEKEFMLFYHLFAKHLPDVEYAFDGTGVSSYISSQDFNENINIVPVADPHVTSEVQRLIRSQLIVDSANQAPDLHDRYTAYRMLYKSMKLTDSEINKLLPSEEDIIPLDPITENQNLIKGKAAVASVAQDHASHKAVHNMILNDPNSAPQIIASTLAHIAEHTAFEFMINMQQMMGIQLPENPYELPMEVQNQIAIMAAQALMQQQQQQAEQAPPPPLDPALVMLEEVKVKDKGIDEKAKADELKAQTEAFKAQLNFETEMKKIELNEKELELKAQGII